jgi:hypothetical protein
MEDLPDSWVTRDCEARGTPRGQLPASGVTAASTDFPKRINSPDFLFFPAALPKRVVQKLSSAGSHFLDIDQAAALYVSGRPSRCRCAATEDLMCINIQGSRLPIMGRIANPAMTSTQ